MVQSYNYSDFARPGAPLPEAPANLDLVMAVPVVVTVELGRTKRKIKEILEFGQGSIVELDKQAGSQVDVIVNGQLIARGDVVVVDDNFSIRITEILKARDALSLL
jgi:flagellar motor switch protein FliN/FliY